MNKSRSIWFVVPWFVILSMSVPAGADDRQKAREHFLKAEAHYKLGRFADALREYSAAYEAAPLPGFLFNIGQCHRQLDNCERAIFFYEGYLREKRKARNRKVVERLIRKCRKDIEAVLEEEKRREELAREEAERKRIEEEKRRAEERRREQERLLALEHARLEAVRAEEQKAKEPAFYETWWFWTIVGGAVAAAAGGTAYYLLSEDETVLPSGSLGTLDLR